METIFGHCAACELYMPINKTNVCDPCHDEFASIKGVSGMAANRIVREGYLYCLKCLFVAPVKNPRRPNGKIKAACGRCTRNAILRRKLEHENIFCEQHNRVYTITEGSNEYPTDKMEWTEASPQVHSPHEHIGVSVPTPPLLLISTYMKSTPPQCNTRMHWAMSIIN